MHQRETRKPRLFGDRAAGTDRSGPHAIGGVTDPSTRRPAAARAAGGPNFHELRLDDVRDVPPILLPLSRR